MKVSELIKQLEDLNPEMNLAMSTDEEGNGFHEEVEVAESNGLAVLWPCGGQLELDEVEGYVDDEDEED